MAPALQIGRMDVPAAADREFNSWYNTVYVPNYEKVPGVIRGRRYRAVEGTPTYLTLYEFEHPKVSESAAWIAQRDAARRTPQCGAHDARAGLARGLRQDGRTPVARPCILGSSRSRRPSPKRFNPRMQPMMAAPGNRVSQGACWR